MDKILLHVLIADAQTGPAALLKSALQEVGTETVPAVQLAATLEDAFRTIDAGLTNTVFIDPISMGLDVATAFVLRVRASHPHIVFVLYLDLRTVNETLGFFAGERKRFKHYFKLAKNVPSSAFSDEVRVTVRHCQSWVATATTREHLEQLQERIQGVSAPKGADTASVSLQLLNDIRAELETVKNQLAPKIIPSKEKSVFLSYRFAEKDYIEGLRELLTREGFSIATGENANTYISQAILERIKAAEHFLCVMTRDKEKKDSTFTTSPWLLEEKGAALAYGKRIVLMIQDGVTDIGGLQGDWQLIHFSSKSFTSAALRAIDQLKSYHNSVA